MLHISLKDWVNLWKRWEIHVMKLWNEWEIRALVLLSLWLQLMLIGLGKQRKRDRRKRIRYTLWLAYLSADWVATVALGSLSNQQGDNTVDSRNTLKGLWAPILLLHLGGPDTITAYSMEDNALWLRHFLGLLVQVSVAFYIFVKSLRLTQLNYVAIPVFVSGIIKYGERTWALRSASSEHFRDSLLPTPDPGPNYARFMDEYALREAEGYTIQWTKMKDPKVVIRTESARDCHIEAATVPKKAFEYFKIYKCLFADLILGFQELEMSKSFFLCDDDREIVWEKAFRIVEIELAFVFDTFYTKAAIHYTRWGRILRIFTLSCTSTTLAVYYYSHKHKYSRVDVIITYILLVGAASLEIIGIIVWFCSDWALIWLDRHEKMPVKHIYNAIARQNLFSDHKWSNDMRQYNLISSCFEVKPTKSCLLFPCYLYRKFKLKTKSEPTATVPPKLKKCIYENLREHASDSKGDRAYCSSRGFWVLDKYQSLDLNWSIEKDFDQSILLWHIATDLCYHKDEAESNSVGHDDCQVSLILSNYVLYLLVQRPYMLPNGIGKIRFQDTCAEANAFIQSKSINDAKIARLRLFDIRTNILPSDVKGDRCKSVLFDACRLAKYLQNRDQKWKIIAGVWVEILVYAASQCRSVHHAQQLAQGGELLTHVWLLLAHLGLSDHFRISEGHARVVLDVR